MALSNNEKKLFINSSLFESEHTIDKLRTSLSTQDYLNRTIISGVIEEGLVVINPTPAQQNFSLTDTAFQYFVEQKIADGYVYGSVESFKKILVQK